MAEKKKMENQTNLSCCTLSLLYIILIQKADLQNHEVLLGIEFANLSKSRKILTQILTS